MNVTDVPAQKLLSASEEAMLTAGVTLLITVLLMPELVPVIGLAQVALEVMTTVITSPFTNAELEYVVPPVPTFPPFRFH